MCGITATIKLRRSGTLPGSNGNSHNSSPSRQALHNQLAESLVSLAHRGPDAEGIWMSDDGTIGLGHRRLAINDLTPDGVQPLHSNDGKIHAVVNGEIYDHDAIRERCIRDHEYQFKGHCDSEVLIALYKIYGAPGFFEHLRGEFSFVIFDERDRRVITARDRFGIKPMYWTIVGDGSQQQLVLTSEVKGFLPLGWEPEWNVSGLISGLSLQAEHTIYKDVWKLKPGSWMEIAESGEIKHHQYWDPEYKNKHEVETRQLDKIILEVRERIVESVRLRLRADVPVGIYLSGGIDSSVVAGIVTKLVREEGVMLGNQDATKRISCFSIQFPEDSGFNEADIAQRTADWLGVQILKKDMNEEELAKNFVECVYHTEHHHFDLNFVGKFCLSTLPRQFGVPVVLTGEGADEHFAGYPFLMPDFLLEPDYAWPDSALAKNDQAREAMQKEMADDLKNMFTRVGMFNHEWETTAPVSRHLGIGNNALKWQPHSGMFAPWVQDSYGRKDMRISVAETMSAEVRKNMDEKWHTLHSSLYYYTRGALPNMILTCLGDRTEMAHSIEARPPFLDHHLVEYVNGLPPSLKIAYNQPEGDTDGTGSSLWWKNLSAARQALSEKWILKEAGKPFITQELYDRRKHPYSAPVKWPREGPIHQLFRKLITEDSVNNLGFLEWEDVKSWLEHGFGNDSDPNAFRKLVITGSWVVLSQRFGVKKATRGTEPSCT
ncbi:asparagine synthase [Colletotrichum costaricense]|uniref:Asparagine synthase n=2 Tax=Colletotrichum acutatum species complex TaxID=2707335 RepID=A0AAJ0E459_9PEZI|nr:asparagine synthase [Colletotrichum costaricense]XP_060383699.1 asparagine synthase [Colletotrichum tamarilloi]KAK1502017.1 asparagine synthase [Colletotrichum tamarilloi]KAK1532146.1 asparagine synthase [Colletotrichum costaricense]